MTRMSNFFFISTPFRYLTPTFSGGRIYAIFFECEWLLENKQPVK